MVAIAIGAAGVLGAGASIYGASQASNAQRDAANQANATQLQMYNQQRKDLAPYTEAGGEGLNALRTYLGVGGNTTAANYGGYNQRFGMDQFTADPGYSFRLSKGLEGLNANAAARGGLISGAALKAAQSYGQKEASNEYTNAYNRFMQEKEAERTGYSDLTRIGQAAAAGTATAAGQYGTAAATNINNAGQAQASGYVGIANGVNNALSQGLSQYTTNNYLSRLRPVQNTNPYSYGAGGYTGEGPFMSGTP
ncbi:MAG: DNA transfer protein p32 [Verrucomicrobiota bacterium]